MPTKRTMNPPKPSNERHELARLVRRIQALTLELQEPRRRHQLHTRELDAKEQMLEQLRWRLAARLVRRIQALTLELQEARRRHQLHTRELDAKEQMLEQLRWRLAAVARRSASDDLGNAA